MSQHRRYRNTLEYKRKQLRKEMRGHFGPSPLAPALKAMNQMLLTKTFTTQFRDKQIIYSEWGRRAGKIEALKQFQKLKLT